MFAGKKSAQIREILISESAWEEMTCLFAPSLVKLPVNERVPVVKNMAESVANQNGWTRAKNIESKNRGRTIYQDGKYYYSVDTQHGRFEQINKKNGKHMGEIDMGQNSIPNSIDKSGGHDLVVK